MNRETILRYLLDTYQPDGIITYGSFADGSAGIGSDFDALVIGGTRETHDDSTVDGTVLDVWVYPAAKFEAPYAAEDFYQIHDGEIVLDRTGAAKALRDTVRSAIAAIPEKSREELCRDVSWCRKMLTRAERGDAEGFYRRHWLLTESLEIYCDLTRQPWFGPKKALRRMREADGVSYALYEAALRDVAREALERWVGRLEELVKRAEG